jgi:hypothetical protein
MSSRLKSAIGHMPSVEPVLGRLSTVDIVYLLWWGVRTIPPPSRSGIGKSAERRSGKLRTDERSVLLRTRTRPTPVAVTPTDPRAERVGSCPHDHRCHNR